MGKLTRRQLLGTMPAVALAGTLAGKAEAAHLESKALMGMGVEDTTSDGGHLTVQTPGAIVDLGRDGLLRVRQRIGSERDLIRLPLDAHFAPWKIGRRTPFCCIVPTAEHVEAALRNGVRLWRQSWTWRKYPEELARFDRQYYSAIK
ncbi:MAG: hypothetical protein NTZ09_05505 [Candidatus Hydrogenedentes bacterium]|nr:hypothetical protein [Candidatus Hydrogenedentota bacterium]